MAISSNPPADAVSSSEQMAAFSEALESRRQLVYNYLDNWPGVTSFKPRDIYDALFSYVRQRGKGLRPSLLLLSCGAVGGDEAQAVPAAAAIEIFHIWTLVHDDIIDRDETRRGHPTVHAQYTRLAREVMDLSDTESAHYGTAVAILAGDLQQSWSFGLLADSVSRGVSPEVTLKLVQRMAGSLTPQLLEGEMLDVQFALAPPAGLSEDDVLHMLSRKTAALLDYAAWAGATIGLGTHRDGDGLAGKLGRFASLCGTAFQLQDDLLGVTGDEGMLGKPVGSDIREGKRTLIIFRALATVDEEARRLILSVLGNDKASSESLKETVAILQQSGAFEYVRELANSYISQALAILETIPESDYKTLLRSWASFLLARKY
jgi:geranylgeranyl diphosphate synthase type I